MNVELDRMAVRLERAVTQEDVFGALVGSVPERLAELKQAYHKLSKIAHPDMYQEPEDRSRAQAVFAELSTWYAAAEAQIRIGEGVNQDTIRLRTKKREYIVEAGFTEGGRFNSYPCHFQEGSRTIPAVLKIAREPGDNELVQNEARILRILQMGHSARKFAAYLPRLYEAFLYQEGAETRQASVFARYARWYSLADVRRVYPKGIDPKDMAWIWRRLLVALGFVHLNGVIHGAVLPENVWILPKEHGLMLVNWYGAVYQAETSGEIIVAADPRYAAWVPAEVIDQETPLPGTDIGMAAQCMLYLLGGDPAHGGGGVPAGVPTPVTAFFKGCTLPGKRARPQDAWALKEEFDELIQKLWGKRSFHPFAMDGNPINR